MKTPARIEVYGFDPIDDLISLMTGQIRLMHRNPDANDLTGAQLVVPRKRMMQQITQWPNWPANTVFW